MLTPHHLELIDAVNSLNRNVILYDSGRYLGSDVYKITYLAGDRMSRSAYTCLAFHPEFVQLLPSKFLDFCYRMDGRKNRKFKFVDYPAIEELANDLCDYLLDAANNHIKPSGPLKTVLKHQDAAIIKILTRGLGT